EAGSVAEANAASAINGVSAPARSASALRDSSQAMPCVPANVARMLADTMDVLSHADRRAGLLRRCPLGTACCAWYVIDSIPFSPACWLRAGHGRNHRGGL